MSSLAHITYGIHAVSMLLDKNPNQVRCLYVSRDASNPRIHRLIEKAKTHRIRYESQTNQQLQSRCGHDKHQGVAALTEAPDQTRSLDQLLNQDNRKLFLLVLDGVMDPHNLGACIRTASAAGVDAVIIPKDNAVQVNATVKKVACGAADILPVFTVTNLARTLTALKHAGLWLVGTCDQAQQSLYETTLTGSIAFVMGSEDKGLRRLTMEHCDYVVKLPMASAVSSLNVSVATGVCLYEKVRQERLYHQ